MSISLQKGGNVSLEKVAPGIKNLAIGLGWDCRSTDGQAFDLDASIFMVTAQGKVRGDSDFIFYGNTDSACTSIHHEGDNLDGSGDGDDETINIDISKVPADVTRLIIAVTIHDSDTRQQNFGQVSNAFVRVVNIENNEEVVRYDLSEDYSVETAIIFGEIYRNNGTWKVKAVGQGYQGGLKALATDFGVSIA